MYAAHQTLVAAVSTRLIEATSQYPPLVLPCFVVEVQAVLLRLYFQCSVPVPGGMIICEAPFVLPVIHENWVGGEQDLLPFWKLAALAGTVIPTSNSNDAIADRTAILIFFG